MSPDQTARISTTSSLMPRLRMVSIIPGIENLAPERTDSSSGAGPPPNERPVISSSRETADRTSSQRSAGTSPASMVSLQTSVVIVNPGGTGRPRKVIRASPAPFPPSRSRSDPSVSAKSWRCGKSRLRWAKHRQANQSPSARAGARDETMSGLCDAGGQRNEIWRQAGLEARSADGHADRSG